MERSIRRRSNTGSPDSLARAAAEARACTVCAPSLPLGPRPVLRVSTTARLLIIGQAPGTKVHASGTPWTDESGKRLRGWLGMTEDEFYDTSRVAILPMGLCYPGRLANGGDAPPRPECAPLWQARLVGLMPEIQLTLLVGSYAQVGALGAGGDDRQGAALAHLSAALFPAAPSVLAHRGLGKAQPVVCRGGSARPANRSGAGAGV